MATRIPRLHHDVWGDGQLEVHGANGGDEISPRRAVVGRETVGMRSNCRSASRDLSSLTEFADTVEAMRPIVALLALGVLAPLLAVSPVAASPSVPPAAATVFPADVDDFTFDSFEAEYRLGRDPQGHATMTTTETLVARFPEFDQNRGVRRAIPATYQGRTTSLDVLSVTDEAGNPRPYSVDYDSSIVTVTAAVPEGSFVRGVQTYVITYTQRDVVDSFANTSAEEFFWNINGTDWRQPFDLVRGTIILDDGLENALIDDQLACYQGYSGSREPCEITREGATIVAEAGPLFPYQNVTMAVAFAPGTFTLFDSSPLASLWTWLQFLAVAVALITMVWAIVLRRTRFQDAPGRPVIVAEYLPPKGLSLLDAAILTHRKPRAVASQLVDFAVRRVLTIMEVDKGGLFSRQQWRLRLETSVGVEGEARRLLTYFFGGGLPGGKEHTLKAQNTTLSTKIQKQLTRISRSMVTRGWRRSIPARFSVGLSALAAASIVGVFVGGILADDEGRASALTFAAFLVPIIAFFLVGANLWKQPLTAEGAELVDHLKGLDVYLELAEADRMRVLQSPEGAERESVDATDSGARLKLYERLLPWAVLGKHEKEWAKVIGEYYADGQQPTWYSSSHAFSVGAFAAGVTSVSSTLSSSYSGTSSSGGSGGGGSSGGGGGGGGGGGV